MKQRHVLPGALVAMAIAFAACGGDDDDTSSQTVAASIESEAGTATSGATTDAATANTDAVATSDPAASSGMTTVDANTATVDEIAAALAANGVSNPERWAREVEEYRPYDVSDPDLGELRDELAKYNPDAATLEAIIASLTV